MHVYTHKQGSLVFTCNVVVTTGEFVTSHVTLWLAVDLAKQSGRDLLRHGLEYLVSNNDALSLITLYETF